MCADEMSPKVHLMALPPNTLRAVECPAINDTSAHCGNCFEVVLFGDGVCRKCGAALWTETE